MSAIFPVTSCRDGSRTTARNSANGARPKGAGERKKKQSSFIVALALADSHARRQEEGIVATNYVARTTIAVEYPFSIKDTLLFRRGKMWGGNNGDGLFNNG